MALYRALTIAAECPYVGAADTSHRGVSVRSGTTAAAAAAAPARGTAPSHTGICPLGGFVYPRRVAGPCVCACVN